jgi:hypothetical protein
MAFYSSVFDRQPAFPEVKPVSGKQLICDIASLG